MNDCLFKPLSLTALSQWVEGIRPAVREQVFNLEGLDMLTGGNPEMARRLLAELLSSNRLDRQELLGLSGLENRQALIDVAHKIKGAARIAQAYRLIECCQALEQACHDAAPADDIALCIKTMNQVMLELEQAFLHQIDRNDNGKRVAP